MPAKGGVIAARWDIVEAIGAHRVRRQARCAAMGDVADGADGSWGHAWYAPARPSPLARRARCLLSALTVRGRLVRSRRRPSAGRRGDMRKRRRGGRGSLDIALAAARRLTLARAQALVHAGVASTIVDVGAPERRYTFHSASTLGRRMCFWDATATLLNAMGVRSPRRSSSPSTCLSTSS